MSEVTSASFSLQTVQIDSIPLGLYHVRPSQSSLLPVTLLHGWGVDSSLMLSTAQGLSRSGFEMIIPDLPGFGSSASPPHAWSACDYAKIVIHLLDHLDVKRTAVIGHSFGGRIGLILASEYPARVSKLVLTSAAGVPPQRRLIPTVRLRAFKAMRAVANRLGGRRIAEQMSTWYNQRYGSPDFKQTSGIMRETFKRIIGEDLRPFAARISAPTLLIWGDQDEDTPLWMGKTLEQAIPDAGLVTFPGAGHYAYLERNAEFVRIVTHFLTH
ncbi:MAG: alpha/beta fold hydrolase [Candidatus Flexifilum sp.]|jgi:pimeloyl-ACP methyl ester carboxylesterase